jgi:hypothetical protein
VSQPPFTDHVKEDDHAAEKGNTAEDNPNDHPQTSAGCLTLPILSDILSVDAVALPSGIQVLLVGAGCAVVLLAGPAVVGTGLAVGPLFEATSGTVAVAGVVVVETGRAAVRAVDVDEEDLAGVAAGEAGGAGVAEGEGQ